MKTLKTTPAIVALLTSAALALSGCAPGEPATQQVSTAGEAVTISDAWVKAADEGMSAAFGELRNNGSDDITVVSATSEASTSLQLHETVENGSGEMVMREIEGGFVIPADGSLSLEPGGDHIMLMGLTAPLRAGDEVVFTLTFSDGSSYTFTAPVKDYSGANENYEHGDSHTDMHSETGEE